MGNMSTGEKIGIGIIAIFVYPFRLIYNGLKTVGVSLGLLKNETDENKGEEK